MSRTGWTLLVWLLWFAAFLALELPAVTGRARWATLSELVWLLEADWRPSAVLVLVAFAWLLVHLVARWA